MFDAHPCAQQGNAEWIFPVIQGHVGGVFEIVADAGVVEGRIQTAIALHHIRHHARDLVLNGHIGGCTAGATASLGNHAHRFLHRLAIDVIERHGGAMFGKHQRCSTANAAACTGDHCNFAVEKSCHCLFPYDYGFGKYPLL